MYDLLFLAASFDNNRVKMTTSCSATVIPPPVRGWRMLYESPTNITPSLRPLCTVTKFWPAERQLLVESNQWEMLRGPESEDHP